MKVKDLIFIDKATANDWGSLYKSDKYNVVTSGAMSPTAAGNLYHMILDKLGEEEIDR